MFHIARVLFCMDLTKLMVQLNYFSVDFYTSSCCNCRPVQRQQQTNARVSYKNSELRRTCEFRIQRYFATILLPAALNNILLMDSNFSTALKYNVSHVQADTDICTLVYSTYVYIYIYICTYRKHICECLY